MWSFGILTYIMLTTCSPFAGKDKNQTFWNITTVNLDFPYDLFADISPAAVDFIKKLLIFDPRYANIMYFVCGFVVFCFLLSIDVIKHYSCPFLWIFSSPEHKVLKVSFCDGPLSVVHASINNFFKQLLRNHSLDFDKTSQEWSLGGPLPKLFKLFQLVA